MDRVWLENVRNIILLCVIVLIAACAEDSADSLVNEAQNYIAAGKLPEASVVLKNALQRKPDNSQARLLLGQVYFSLGQLADAEKELVRARELGVSPEVSIPLLAQVLVENRKYEEVLDLSIDGLTEQNQAVVLAAQGLAMLAQKKDNEATVFVDQAVEKNPASAYVLVAKAHQLTGGAIDVARERLEEALNLEPSYAPAWSLLGDIEQREAHPTLAEEHYSRAIELRINNELDRLKRVMVRIQLRHYIEAQQDLNELIKVLPKSPGVNYAQGIIHFLNKNYKAALTAFEIIERNEDNYPMALFYAGSSHYLLGSGERAEHYAQRYYGIAPDSIPGRMLLANIRFDQGDYKGVEELIQPVVQVKDDNVAAHNLLADALLRLGKTQEAVDLLVKVVALEPDSAGAQVRLGAGLLAGEAREEAIGHIERAIQMDPQFHQADILLILNYLREKNYDRAIAAGKAYQARDAGSVTPYNLLGRVYTAAGEEELAVQAYSEARDMSPGDPVACDKLAVLALKNKDLVKARVYYHEILANYENNLTALVKLARLDALEKKYESMLEYLNRAMETHPAEAGPRVVLANYYVANGEPGKTMELMVGLDEAAMNSPPVLNVMVLSHLAQGQFLQAKVVLEQLLETSPESPRLHFELSKVYAGLNDKKQMQSELERSVELGPGYIEPRLVLANLLMAQGQLDKVAQHLTVLENISAEHPDVLELGARLAALNGDYVRALQLSQVIFDSQPNTLTMISLSRAKHRSGDTKGALQLQEQWCADRPQDVVANLELANSYLAEKNIDAAIEKYEFVLTYDEDNLVALNNLAWHLRESEPKRALNYAKRATEVDPESADIMDTLAMALLANGEAQKAQRAIEKALVKNPDSPPKLYHSAVIDIAAGDRAAAAITLAGLLDGNIDFADKDTAYKLLSELQK